MTSWVFPAVTAAISAVFALVVLQRYLAARKRHQLLWTLGLLGMTAAALTQVIAAQAGHWPEGVYRTYYWLAGSLVGSLGAGTFYLIGRRKLADYFLYAVVALVALQAAVCAFSPVDSAALAASATQTGVRAASAPMRVLIVILNIAGAGAMLAGAILSWRSTKRVHNLLLIAGTVLFSIGGSTAGVDATGDLSQWALYIGNLAGIVLLFAGFLLGRPAPDRTQPQSQTAPAASPPA